MKKEELIDGIKVKTLTGDARYNKGELATLYKDEEFFIASFDSGEGFSRWEEHPLSSKAYAGNKYNWRMSYEKLVDFGPIKERNTNFSVGDTVKIRSWDDMEKEYGLTPGGHINCSHTFTTSMRYMCGNTYTLHDVSTYTLHDVSTSIVTLTVETGYIITTDMIEHVSVPSSTDIKLHDIVSTLVQKETIRPGEEGIVTYLYDDGGVKVAFTELENYECYKKEELFNTGRKATLPSFSKGDYVKATKAHTNVPKDSIWIVVRAEPDTDLEVYCKNEEDTVYIPVISLKEHTRTPEKFEIVCSEGVEYVITGISQSNKEANLVSLDLDGDDKYWTDCEEFTYTGRMYEHNKFKVGDKVKIKSGKEIGSFTTGVIARKLDSDLEIRVDYEDGDYHYYRQEDLIKLEETEKLSRSRRAPTEKSTSGHNFKEGDTIVCIDSDGNTMWVPGMQYIRDGAPVKISHVYDDGIRLDVKGRDHQTWVVRMPDFKLYEGGAQADMLGMPVSPEEQELKVGDKVRIKSIAELKSIGSVSPSGMIDIPGATSYFVKDMYKFANTIQEISIIDEYFGDINIKNERYKFSKSMYERVTDTDLLPVAEVKTRKLGTDIAELSGDTTSKRELKSEIVELKSTGTRRPLV